MSQPFINPVSLSALGAAIVFGGVSYAVSRRPAYGIAGALSGVGLVLGYTKVIKPGRIYMFSTLQIGAQGPAVSKAQERLIFHGFPPLPGEVEGVYGAQTAAAVQKFQAARQLPASGIIDPATWDYLVARPVKGVGTYDVDDILDTLKKLNYSVLTDGGWNIVGVRASVGSTNSFDDEMHLFRRTGTGWEHHSYPITADPGTYYLKTPMNGVSTAAVVPGQYPDAYKFGLHKGQYEALVQTGPLNVYRDGNRDAKFDYDPNSIIRGTYGINIHKASADSKSVDRWSAGCQVFARERDFSEFINLLKQTGQQRFTYTLLTENQVHDAIA